MQWKNTETPTFAGSDGTKPNVVETFELVDRDGNVAVRYEKNVDGSLVSSSLSLTPAVARVIQGTIDTALSDDDSIITLGGLVGTEGVDFAGDDDGTELIPWIAANLEKIPADSVHDDTGGQFSVTFHPGVNSVAFISADAQLTFSETTAGAEAVRSLLSPLQVPETVPVVPETSPGVQDVIDALVTLGLVTQSD